jgi:two-component system, OmpR family, response regulator RstA
MNDETHRYRILLVEDDAELASMVADFLSQHGFLVRVEPRGDAAAKRIIGEDPDAVVLDVNLPGLDGFEVCRMVREGYRGTIIMLTARREEVDEVLGLELGADDYMAKPVRPRALLARLHMHLRHAFPEAPAGSHPIIVGALVIDAARRTAELHGQRLDLSTAEFDLLALLAHHAGHALSRNDIYLALNGVRYDGTDRSIDLRVSRLRKKLGEDPANPQRITSVWGTGYQLSVKP